MFYSSIIGYAAEALIPAATVIILLYVLCMSDYADTRELNTWQRIYLTHWWTHSVSYSLAIVIQHMNVYTARLNA